MSRRIAARPAHTPSADEGDARDLLQDAVERREVDRLRAAVYGPGTDAGAAARLRALQGPPLDGTGRRADHGAGRRAVGRRVVAIAALAAAALGFVVGWTTRPTPQTAQQLLQERVLDSRGTLSAEDYQRIYPSGLPSDWAGVSTGTSRRGIRGAQVLRLAVSGASSRLLIVPTCAATDRWVDWTLTGRDGRELGRGRNPCGGFEGQVANFSADDRAAGLGLAVVPAGREPFAVTVYEQ